MCVCVHDGNGALASEMDILDVKVFLCALGPPEASVALLDFLVMAVSSLTFALIMWI